jgi:uncharacterized protein (UPF0212 family)
MGNSIDTFIITACIVVVFLPSISLLTHADAGSAKNKKSFIKHTLISITCILIYMMYVMLAAKVFIPRVNEQNADIARSVTNCTVYNVTTYINVTSQNIEYVVYYKHESSNGTYFYTGICKRLSLCYPAIEDHINCYPVGLGYVIRPKYLVTWNLMAVLVIGVIVMFIQFAGHIYILHNYYDKQELSRCFRPVVAVTQPTIAPNASTVTCAAKQLYNTPPTIAVYDPDLDERKVSIAIENYGNPNTKTENYGNVSATAPKCSACMENTPTVMFVGCNHVCLCAACAVKYTSLYCPICRKPGGKIRVYQ